MATHARRNMPGPVTPAHPPAEAPAAGTAVVHSDGLGERLVRHLDRQIAAARKLLSCVLEQGRAIRERAVDRTVAAAAAVRNEVEQREQLERERAELLAEAARALGTEPDAVTLEAICSLLDPRTAEAARHRSHELRGLLAEIAREHQTNRILLRQELAFLDHLLRLASGPQGAAYRPDGDLVTAAPHVHRVIDRRV